MQRLIISTVGTSLLTNQINRKSEDSWYAQLRDTANVSLDALPTEVNTILHTLKARANQKLAQASIPMIRRASAELNGIYGLYDDNLEQGRKDIHWLIATDTAQGKISAEIVQSFLKAQGLLNVNIFTPPGLSTASTEAFSRGIAALIAWMGEILPPYQEDQYKICFNLVGSFKSLQGYLNTIGMFYADEMIYIFEGKQAEMIVIPRLPVQVNIQEIEPYKVPLAMMDAGEIPVALDSLKSIPETWLFSDGKEVTLSTWGQLLWNQCKTEILRGDLLKFPGIHYQQSFQEDYKSIVSQHERFKLQETLAKVAQLLAKSQGNIAVLKDDGGLLYSRYRDTDIDHFRVNLSQRVSCRLSGSNLVLRHYDSHDYVQGRELNN